MASYDQMVTHYRMVGEQRAAEEEARRQAAQQAAALQSQRDAEMADIQRRQQFQQADLQSQLSAQQAGYQQQRDVLGAGLQERRDYLGNAIQQEQMRVGAGLQSQRDTQLSGQRMQEAEHGMNLQAQLSQAQLNQQEQMRLQRLNSDISWVDQRVQNNELSAEDGALLKTELVTKLNPLRNRAMEADRLRSIVQTQQIEQQNQHQATLFNQRQEWLANGAQGNIRYLEDPVTGERQAFQVGPQGEIQPIDFSRNRREQEAHQLGMASGIQGIQQRQELFPGQLQAQEAGIAATRVGTAATASATNRAEARHPSQMAMDFLNIQGEEQRQAFTANLNPLQIEAMQTNIANAQQTNRAAIQDFEARRQTIPLELRQRQAQLDQAAQNLQQSADLHPGVMANQLLAFEGEQQRQEYLAQRNPIELEAMTTNINHTLAQMESQAQEFRARGQQIPVQLQLQRANLTVAKQQIQLNQRNLQNGLTPQQRADMETSIRREVAVESAPPRAGQQPSALYQQIQAIQARPNETPEQLESRRAAIREAEINRRMRATERRLGANAGGGAGANPEQEAGAFAREIEELGRVTTPQTSVASSPTSDDQANVAASGVVAGLNAESATAMRVRVAQAISQIGLLTPGGPPRRQALQRIERALSAANGQSLSTTQQAEIRQAIRQLPSDVRQQILGQ